MNQENPPAFFAETKNNICKLLRDAWLILDDGPDESDRARAEEKLGEALALARNVCANDPSITA